MKIEVGAVVYSNEGTLAGKIVKVTEKNFWVSFENGNSSRYMTQDPKSYKYLIFDD